MEFKDRLAAALEAGPLTKAAMAEQVDQAPSAISNWLAGRRPSEEMIDRLAQALNVNARWLANGAGPTPRALRDLELARLATVRWAPRLVPEDGGRSGGNAALFTIRPTLQHVLREALQNSNDVGLGGGPVTIDVRLLGLTGEARAALLEALRWEELYRHLKGSVEAAEDQQIATALREGLEIANGGELLVLLISDYNTEGLTGPETGRRQLRGARPRHAVLQQGRQYDRRRVARRRKVHRRTRLVDQHGAVPLRSLRARARRDLQRGRLLGRSELAWHPNPDGDRDFDGPMWLGETDRVDARMATVALGGGR